jgi:lactoylglutathione lyase
MPFGALHHLKIDVEDLARSLRFYCEQLEFRQIVRYELDDGGVIVQVSPTGEPPGVELWYEIGGARFSHDRLHFAFAVTEIDALVQRLATRGVSIAAHPFRKGHELIAFVRDPDGYLIELNEDTGYSDVTAIP